MPLQDEKSSMASNKISKSNRKTKAVKRKRTTKKEKTEGKKSLSWTEKTGYHKFMKQLKRDIGCQAERLKYDLEKDFIEKHCTDMEINWEVVKEIYIDMGAGTVLDAVKQTIPMRRKHT